MKHGDVVNFRHENVQGTGKIVGSGADGVTVSTEDGREHQVRHEHLEGPAPAAPADGAGEAAPNPPPLFTPEQTQGIPAKVAQPVKDEAGLFKAAPEALGQLQEWLNKGRASATSSASRPCRRAWMAWTGRRRAACCSSPR